MKTEKLQLSDGAIARAAQVLGQGGVVVFPSENTYGLLADSRDSQAVEMIYALKGRDGAKPLGFYIDARKAADYGYVSEGAQKLMHLWPCAISIIVPKKEVVSDLVTRGYKSIMMVCPDSFCITLNQQVDFPIACTSANLSGQPAVTAFSEAVEVFEGRVPLIIDGENSRHGANGTIIDFSQSPPLILRIGPFPVEKIREFVPDAAVAEKLI